jgi:hypothetical protein
MARQARAVEREALAVEAEAYAIEAEAGGVLPLPEPEQPSLDTLLAATVELENISAALAAEYPKGTRDHELAVSINRQAQAMAAEIDHDLPEEPTLANFLKASKALGKLSTEFAAEHPSGPKHDLAVRVGRQVETISAEIRAAMPDDDDGDPSGQP